MTIDSLPLATDVAGQAAGLQTLPVCPAVVLVDQCDVIYDDTVWIRWLHQRITRTARFLLYEAFRDVWEREYLTRVHRGELGYWEALRDLLTRTGLARGPIEELCVAAVPRRKMFEENLRVLPGVKATLHQLRSRGLRLALFAKCAFPPAQVQANLQRMGIETCFDEVLASIELTREATDCSLWSAAVARLKMAPHTIAFVSARCCHIESAVAVGMAAIAIDVTVPLPGVVRVEQFTDVPRVIPPSSSRALAG